MIAIVNIDDNPRAEGDHLYAVYINKKEICRFTHMREDGLSQCLFKASKAVAHNAEVDGLEGILKLVGLVNK